MTNCCGSIFYIAPEVWFNQYNEMCDIWSIGVIVFALLTGRFPFDDKKNDKIEEKICYKKLKFKKKDKKYISKPVRKLIKLLLQKSYLKRISGKHALFELLSISNYNYSSSIRLPLCIKR